MEKETQTITNLELVDSVTVLGYWKPTLALRQQLTEKVTLQRLRTFRHSQLGSRLIGWSFVIRYLILFLSFPEYCLKTFWFLVWNRPKFLACHNLILLPVAVLGKFLCVSRLIYVPHELETHRTGLKGPLRGISKLIERFFIRFVDSTIVVCEPIAQWYRDSYGISNVHVVPNVPYHPCPGTSFEKTTLLRQHFLIPDTDIICMYQGLISKGRGIEELLGVFESLPRDRHLVVMGYGEQANLVKEYASKYPNIHFKEAVPVDEILSWTSSADVGLFFNSQSMTLSYQFSLPNKFFEYAIGGLYIVISSNFLEQARFLNQHGLGVSVSPEISALKMELLSLTKESISRNVESSALFRQSIGWQSFEGVYRIAYDCPTR